MRRMSIHEIKTVELDILKYVKQCCRDNGLQYYLMFGTLIGAIRHKGFIPWDDDIDIALPRKDYYKLIEIMDANDSSIYKLISCNNVEGYGMPLAKVVDSRTKLVQNGAIGNEKQFGVYIDLFILDNIPDDLVEREKFFKKMKKESKKWYLSKRKFLFRTGSRISDLIKGLISLPFKIESAYHRCLKMDKMAAQYQDLNTKEKTVVMFALAPEKTVLTSEEWETIESVEFEGELFDTTKYYDKNLTNIYGDYMTPPSELDETSVHDFVAYWRE